MTLQFLDLYIVNLELLSIELSRNQQFIQHWDMNIQKLASIVQQRLNQFDEISDDKLDVNEQESKIEIIYSLLKQIAKCDSERRSLASTSTEILNGYLTLLDENFINRTVDILNGNNEIEELFPNFQDLASEKSQTNDPISGNVLVAEWLKNLHSDETAEDVNKNVTMSNGTYLGTYLTSNSNEITCDNVDAAKMKSGSSVSDLLSEADHFQIFKRKLLDFGSEMRNRHGNEIAASGVDQSEDVVYVSSESEENSMLSL